MKKTLREYQEEATCAVFDYFKTNTGHPLVVAPTGAGKSLLISEFINRACQMHAGTRFLVLAHVKELLQQNAQELIGQWPQADISFYCAGLGQKKATAQIVFASVQSLYKKPEALIKVPDIVIIDECHLVNPSEGTMYGDLIEKISARNPLVKVIGYTATPYRPDTGLLTDGDLFDDVVYDIEVQRLIDEGYLVAPITPKTETELLTEGVQLRGGDYIESQLQKAVNTDDLNQKCVEEIIHHGNSRKKVLIFTAGIDHCEAVAAILPDAKCVHSKKSNAENDKVLAEHRSGGFKYLVNMAKLTTGYNDPEIDMIAFMRPTRSPVLYVQMVGRGIRTAPGKDNCVILDFGGVVKELGPIDQVNIVKKGGDGSGEAPIKQCPKCYAYSYSGLKTCEECGYEFSDGEPNIGSKSAKNQALLVEQQEPKELTVNFMLVNRHMKEGKPDSLRVTYGTNEEGVVYEWLCPNHKGYARRKFEEWHRAFSDLPTPEDTDTALTIQYKQPERIVAKKEGKFWRIKKYIFPVRKEVVDEIPW